MTRGNAPLMRSKLFVPGSRPELFGKALAGPADAISIDLEDAVQESRKADARRTVSEFLESPEAKASTKVIIVRVNGLATPHFEADVSAVVRARLDLLNLPMAETPGEVRSAAAALARVEQERSMARAVGILINIESSRALRRAAELASADPRVAGLQLGLGDLFEPLGIDRRDTAAVHQVQLALRLAAGEAGVWACDSAFAAVQDADGYRDEADAARRLGYVGKSCIHPGQVPIANDVFRPSDAEIEDALRVVEASRRAEREGVGAFMVDGKMVDLPFTRRAEAVLALAGELGLLPGS